MKLRVLPSSRQLGGRRLLVRLDLNVPVNKGRITDDFKIKAALPTLRSLRGSPVIVITHRGEPAGRGTSYRFQKNFSLTPIVSRLQKELKGNVFLASGSWVNVKKQAQSLQPGDIMILENIRFWPGETANDKQFARELAALADVYINDAFAVSHRNHASVSALTNYLPSYAGPQLVAEVRALEKVLTRHHLTLILGGAKIATKLPLITHLLPRCKSVLIGGAMANTLLRARGYEIGASLYDKGELRLAKRLRSKKIIIPHDVVIRRGATSRTVSIMALQSQDSIIDIGPATASRYADSIKKSKTIVWNGPLGKFEIMSARAGTTEVVKAIQRVTAKKAFSVVGGGETLEALALLGNVKKVSWASTGGGATLAFLSGQTLPGLKGLLVS